MPSQRCRSISNAESMLASSLTSHGNTRSDPIEAASGRPRRSSASPWNVNASSAPWAAQASATPQPSERSLATPMITPRLPCIRLPRMGWGAGALSVIMVLLIALRDDPRRFAVVAQGDGIEQGAVSDLSICAAGGLRLLGGSGHQPARGFDQRRRFAKPDNRIGGGGA